MATQTNENIGFSMAASKKLVHRCFTHFQDAFAATVSPDGLQSCPKPAWGSRVDWTHRCSYGR